MVQEKNADAKRLVSVSIIICTKARAESLAATLECLAGVLVVSAARGEVLVVDNGSRDNTAEVAARFAERIQGWPVRLVTERRGGQALARNTGMARATGDIIVFTDDDVRPEMGWLDALVAPMTSGRADAVLGRVDIAPHLLRPWMTDLHKSWIAATCAIDFKAPNRLVGANMAFKRSVLNKVPSFDENLGPGALGFGDDTLFSAQLLGAGFVLAGVNDAVIIHHCDADRISAKAYLNSARKMGESAAYIAHHWHGKTIPRAGLRAFLKRIYYRSKLAGLENADFIPQRYLEIAQHIRYVESLALLSRAPADSVAKV